MVFRMVQKIWTDFLAFCHNSLLCQTDGQTDALTDGQTEFSSLDRVYIDVAR